MARLERTPPTQPAAPPAEAPATKPTERRTTSRVKFELPSEVKETASPNDITSSPDASPRRIDRYNHREWAKEYLRYHKLGSGNQFVSRSTLAPNDDGPRAVTLVARAAKIVSGRSPQERGF